MTPQVSVDINGNFSPQTLVFWSLPSHRHFCYVHVSLSFELLHQSTEEDTDTSPSPKICRLRLAQGNWMWVCTHFMSTLARSYHTKTWEIQLHTSEADHGPEILLGIPRDKQLFTWHWRARGVFLVQCLGTMRTCLTDSIGSSEIGKSVQSAYDHLCQNASCTTFCRKWGSPWMILKCPIGGS